MTTYTAISDATLSQDKPLTQSLMRALRDNVLALGENDSSLPSNMKPRELLGTITLSGASSSLSSLDLTAYGMLMLVVSGVSHLSSTTNYMTIGGVRVTKDDPSSGGTGYAMAFIDLATGILASIASITPATGAGAVGAGNCSITNASTAVTCTAVGSNFDAGTVKVYGVK